MSYDFSDLAVHSHWVAANGARRCNIYKSNPVLYAIGLFCERERIRCDS